MTAIPVYVGVIVRDLERSQPWYQSTLGCRLTESGDGWSLLSFQNGSSIELFEGDPRRPGLVFPSYGDQSGPPVMPGFGVEEPEELAAPFSIARRLPDWVVVVAPDGLRIVLSDREGDGQTGLVGFRFSSPQPEAQREFLDQLGITAEVQEGPVKAVPIVVAGQPGLIEDPDHNQIQLSPAE